MGKSSKLRELRRQAGIAPALRRKERSRMDDCRLIERELLVDHNREQFMTFLLNYPFVGEAMNTPEFIAGNLRKGTGLGRTLAVSSLYMLHLRWRVETGCGYSKMLFDMMRALPHREQFAYATLQGVFGEFIAPPFHYGSASACLEIITKSPVMRDEWQWLCDADNGEGCRASLLIDLEGGTILPQLERLTKRLSGVALTEADVLVYSQVLCTGDHMRSVCDVLSGRVLCDAGDLVLHYRNAWLNPDDALCLSRRTRDGLLMFYPQSGAPPLSAKAVRQMRAFVTSYKGDRMSGLVSSHPFAARLCRMVGLKIQGEYGVLESSDST